MPFDERRSELAARWHALRPEQREEWAKEAANAIIKRLGLPAPVPIASTSGSGKKAKNPAKADPGSPSGSKAKRGVSLK